jgi:hypothetical protein
MLAGFGCISDVVTSPDGLLYVTSLSDGTIYRIAPQYSMAAIIGIIYAYGIYIVDTIIAVTGLCRNHSLLTKL